VALVVSDVVGNDLSVIASGPTVADSSTYEDAYEILEDRKLWDRVPASVRHAIESGQSVRGDGLQPIQSDNFESVTNFLLATNDDALRAASSEASKRGYDAEILSNGMTGEAREVGRYLVESALERTVRRPLCLIAGGETTVTVRGTGKGGRNLEMALAASLGMHGENRAVVFLSGGTDGIDGATDAAGAWATPDTVAAGKKKGLDARDFLANNDSYTFFLHIDGLFKTGHTHTNVMDVQIMIIDRPMRNSS
jgi:hydroxypyruvate reductase